MTAPDRTRLDEALVARGLAPSRSRARDMVKRGTVTVAGETETRPARMVAVDAAIGVDDPAAGYVSRAALKLIAGLDAFGFDPSGRTVLDLGASTGGFTQVLLKRGAAHVLAVDVGHGEMHAELAADPRVTLIEGLNARDLTRAHLDPYRVEAVTADLSFISLKLALPPALTLAEPKAWGLFLVKPQFEVGRAALGKGGVVRDAETAEAAAADIAAWLEGGAAAVPPPSQMGEGDHAKHGGGGGLSRGARHQPPPPAQPVLGPAEGRTRGAVPLPRSAGEEPQRWRVDGVIPSPLAGGSGNTEFLLGARRD